MSPNSLQRPPLPRHSSNGSKRGHASARDARLSVIVEDGSIPSIPPKTHNRPFNRRWNLGEPPRHSFEKSPPKYSVWDVTGPKGEKLVDVRNNKYIASRGGCWRICIILLMMIAIVVALVLGLVIGLRKRNSSSSNQSSPSNSSNSSNSSSSSTPDVVGPFPAGSYTFTTFLDTVTTNCTSVSTYWQCPPSFTYHEMPSGAPTFYQWIINGSSSDPSSNFTISSTNNPFAINFTNEPLTFLDKNLESERYTFSTAFKRMLVPALGIECFFAHTVFEANLYTKRPQSYPEQSSASDAPSSENSSSIPFQDWKFAMDVTQSSGGGSTVPECYHVTNNVKGAKIIEGITPQPTKDTCSCVYKNYDPS